MQALPDTVAEKGDLQDRVDALDGIQVPEVNDQDGNGIPDFIDSQLAFFNKASSPNVSGTYTLMHRDFLGVLSQIKYLQLTKTGKNIKC
ncbi:Uncharacterised protein [Escherichia coli]|nr:hypothetical protein [Escherichia coli]STH18246.1 Uncharacterised protein [Escherichia coli]